MGCLYLQEKIELSRTCLIGKLIRKIQFRDTLLQPMAGRTPLKELLRTADYKGFKGTQILSSGVCSYLQVRLLYEKGCLIRQPFL